MFLSSHDEVVGVVLVVHDVFEIDAGFLIQLLEEFLVENEGDPAYLLDPCLGFGTLVDEIGSDGNRELTPKLLALEALEGIALAVRPDQNVEFVLRDRMIGGRRFCPPANF